MIDDLNPPPAAATASATASPVSFEELFPGYLVTAKISETSRRLVFRARDTRLDRPAIIKALVPDLEHNPDAVRIFFDEARRVARLRHENIVRGLDAGRAGAYFYFVTEDVKGESLADKLERLARKRLPPREALAVTQQLAQALLCASENGLTHRAVEPAHVILGNDGAAQLDDLGVAREIAWPDPEAVVRDAPFYAAPERIRNDPNADIRADLYSLGCVWFHMLLGRPPFAGATPEEILGQHLEAPAPQPAETEAGAGVSVATGELIPWLLAKDPGDRPTPRELLDRLATEPPAGSEDAPAIAAEDDSPAAL